MTVPWRFLLGLVVGFLLAIFVFILFLYTQLGVPTRLSQWVFDISHKKELLAAKVSGPRLLVLAGSNALFGINAQLIEQKTGYPTINMATTGGLFLDYQLYWIKKTARPGDTILLALEYDYYTEGFEDFAEFNDNYILSRDPEFFYQMSLPEKISMATRIPFKRLQQGWAHRHSPEHEHPPAFPYSPYTPITPGIDCLDDHGDEVFNFEATRRPPGPEMQHICTLLSDGPVSEKTESFALIGAFIEWARQHHISVLATFPNIIYQPVYDQPLARQSIASLTHFYASHDVPVIGTAGEAMLPADQFFDTNYHLTHEAALERTARLIPELEPYLRPTK